MAAPLAAAGIQAGASLLSGVMGAQAQAEQQRRQNILNSLGKEMEAKQRAGQMLAQGTQQATNTMLQGFGQALG